MSNKIKNSYLNSDFFCSFLQKSKKSMKKKLAVKVTDINELKKLYGELG